MLCEVIEVIMIRVNIALSIGFLLSGMRYYLPLDIESISDAVVFYVGAVLVITVLVYAFFIISNLKFQQSLAALAVLILTNSVLTLHLVLRIYYWVTPVHAGSVEEIMSRGGYREYVDLLQSLGMLLLAIGVLLVLFSRPKAEIGER